MPSARRVRERIVRRARPVAVSHPVPVAVAASAVHARAAASAVRVHPAAEGLVVHARDLAVHRPDLADVTEAPTSVLLRRRDGCAARRPRSRNTNLEDRSRNVLGAESTTWTIWKTTPPSRSMTSPREPKASTIRMRNNRA